MLDNRNDILIKLHELNLTDDEAMLYIELLKEPNTHLRLSHNTGINRTKVYRLIEQLEKRSLIARRSDDRGTFLVAKDPSSLEIELVTQEEKLKHQLKTLHGLMPALSLLKAQDSSTFVIHSYEGVEGFKQMLWHELRTKDVLLAFGNVVTEELVSSRRWSEKFRARIIATGYTIRELINEPYENLNFTNNTEFIRKVYTARSIPEKMLPIETPMMIYNDTVAIYQFRHMRRVGVEIVNKAFANTMRCVFEHYWNLAEKLDTHL